MEAAKIKVTKPRAPRAKKVQPVEENPDSLLSSFVFMEKPIALLEIGIKTETNVILYGPGGHGKSELALEFFLEKGINPYIITMGSGMTTDRLFGGMNIKLLDSGKIEYLVENSFMNHEYVIFEELMDAPDFILEQLKDILSSGVFRNGTQVFPIKTRFIVGNTNKTREEFSKNDSLKALMERFPLEYNVIWDNYTDIAYTTLLERKFGKGQVDPIIPFLLQEFVKAGITISPRIALTCYKIYEICGPDSLNYIAEFSKKPELIKETLKKFSATIKFRESSVEVHDIIKELTSNTQHSELDQAAFVISFEKLTAKFTEISAMSVIDELAQQHANVVKAIKETHGKFVSSFNEYRTVATPSKKKKSSVKSEAIETEF